MNVGRAVRVWGLAVVLALVAFGSYRAALDRDTDVVSTEDIVYEQVPGTPLLSGRRAPLTLQAPVVDAEIAPVLQAMIDASPEATCLQVQTGDRVLEPTSNTRTQLLPASNQKLFTTYAALELLGSDFTFTTEVRADGAVAGGVLDGNLYVIGDGDPYLTTENWWEQYEETDGRFHTRLEDLADDIAATGVVTVTGSLIGDESLYDTVRAGPWAERILIQQQSGPLSALAVNEGFNDWPSDTNGVARGRSPSSDPALDAVAVLNQLLAERGVQIEGGPATGVTPPGTTEVAAISSPNLVEIVTHVNSYSSNYGAELLLKRIGLFGAGEGSTVAGSGVMLDLLRTDGVPTDGLLLEDGSGLADTNRVTCAAIAAVLAAAGPDSDFARSLAIGAERGSLLLRFVESTAAGDVYAKTGTLNDSTALSGYVRSVTDPEQWLTFAYVANDELIIANTEVRELQDPFVVAITDYPGEPVIEDLDPLEPIDADS
ncbi:MAG: D-alanyl-D-alanine carboxypeptidase [Actinomycetota bacterium]